MESIIARQKIARRRALVPTSPERKHSSSSLFGTSFPASSHRAGVGSDSRVDFLFLEGAIRSRVKLRDCTRTGSGIDISCVHKVHETKKKRTARPSPFPAIFAAFRAIFATLARTAALGLTRSFVLFARGTIVLPSLAAAAFSTLARAIFPSTDSPRPIDGTEKNTFADVLPPRTANLQSPAFSFSVQKATRLFITAGFALALVAGAFGTVAYFRNPPFPMPAGALLPDENSAQDLLLAFVSPELADDGAEAEENPAAELPSLTAFETQSYTVRSGDSIASAAKKFGLRVDTLISMNGITSSASFRAGTVLKVPNMDGLVRKVRSGDSLGSIAKLYGTDLTSLADANDLGSSVIRPGQVIFIPGARLSESELKRIFGERVVWPVRGTISSNFGYRDNPFTGIRQFHAGLDIVVGMGSAVGAAMDGKVADVGYNSVFGNYVILNHADGLQTLYGHLKSLTAKKGQTIPQSQPIGLSGSTGYSTGPHLHFALFRKGSPINPLKYLK
jgi:murein DD-endopeptidase MepM/ murein hydrolase activator NlpD